MTSTATFISNIQNNKKVYFRKQLWPFLLIIVLLGYAVINQVQEINKTFDQVIAYQAEKSDQNAKTLDYFKKQKNVAEKESTEKQLELEKVNRELTAKEDELTSKIKELQSKQAEVSKLQTEIQNQQSQLSANSTELAKLRARPPLFTFNNHSSLANIAEKKAAVQEVVENAYDTIVEIYGPPYALNEVSITFVDFFNIQGASGEIQISNSEKGLSIDIRLKDFDKNNFNDVSAIIHEIIHSFHGMAVFDSTVMEEGITVAACDVVMAKMITEKKLIDFGHLYINISQNSYHSYNSSLSIPKDINAFYGSADAAKYYQLAGFAWMRLYEADHLFFKNFNERYYPYIQRGQYGSDEIVKAVIKATISSVGGQSIENYLGTQKAFNPI